MVVSVWDSFSSFAHLPTRALSFGLQNGLSALVRPDEYVLLSLHSFPGYARLRMHNKGGSPVAFVEFSDVRVASAALTALQGFVLASSDRGGMRIEYAKTKMGEVGTISGIQY